MPHFTRLSVLDKVEEKFLTRMEKVLRMFDVAYGEHEGTREELREQFRQIVNDPQFRDEWQQKMEQAGHTESELLGYLRREMTLDTRRRERANG